jgi:acyl-CoA reductase-like NAD-dependent aldehyde dehydrogenase
MSATGAASDLIRERYAPYRAEQGKHLPFESADFRELKSPWDQSPIAMVGYMNEAQAFENLSTLCRTFDEKKQPRAFERQEILRRAARHLADRQAEFADLIAWEGGKPLRDAQAEVVRAINTLEYAADEGVRLCGSEIPMRGTKAASGHIAFTFPEPIGVVFAISAFNHPLNLIVHQVAPAIAVGCPVMIKPAAETPLSCLHFIDLLYEAGLPPEMCLPLMADNDVTEKIARSDKIGFLTFIGSAKVGWYLRSVLAPGVRFSLEHGGSAPVIVDSSADLDKALPIILKGGYYHAGQVCVSTQRVFVHEDIMSDFEKRFVAQVRALKTDNPRLETTDCGPIIRRRDVERIHSCVSESIEAGAKLLIGGRELSASTYAPTVIRGARKEDRVFRDEIFGPVVCIDTFRDLKSAIACSNDVPWRFQAAVFSQDIDRAMEAAKGIRASAVMINESTAFRVDWMPFRGDGPSGFGTGGIPFGARDMTSDKMVVIKNSAFEV